MKKIVRVSVVEFGCSFSYAEAEMLKGILESSGYDIVDPDNADVVIIHGCVVKTPSEKKALKLAKKLKSRGKKIILSGCLGELRDIPEFSILGLQCIDRVVEVVERVLKGERVVLRSKEKIIKLGFPRILRNPIVGIVPICEGCVHSCAFCEGKFARKPLKSYPKDKILEEIQRLLNLGVKEIWLTAQDTGAYGKDIGESLPSLMAAIYERFHDRDVLMRVGMMSPDHAAEFLEDFLDVLKEDIFFKFLHIPVQSGSNKVLRDMNRCYTVEEFEEVVQKSRRRIKEISIATDVIVGYPTETEEDFIETIELLRRVRPDFLNISRFWPRPLCEASKLPQLPGWIVKNRSTIVSLIYREISYRNYLRFVGRRVEVIVDEIGKGGYIARTIGYRPVFLKEAKLGKRAAVKIVEARPNFMIGVINQ